MMAILVYVDDPADPIGLVKYFRPLTGRGPLELKQAIDSRACLAKFVLIGPDSEHDSRTLKTVLRRFPTQLGRLRLVEHYRPENTSMGIPESLTEVTPQYVKNVLRTHDEIAREVRNNRD